MSYVANTDTQAFHVEPMEPMKPRRVTALQLWMIENGRTDTALAAEINERLPEAKIHPRTVGRWRKGLSAPRPAALRALMDMSGGKVDANSFVKPADEP
jgi:hypothetical protein